MKFNININLMIVLIIENISKQLFLVKSTSLFLNTLK